MAQNNRLPSVLALNVLPALSRLSLHALHIGCKASKRKARAAAEEAPGLIKEKCIGFVAVSRFTKGTDDKAPSVVFIEELFVDPAYRSKGVARCLLQRAIGTEPEGGSTDAVAALVVRWNATQQESARELYGKVGFVPMDVPDAVLFDKTRGRRTKRVPAFRPISEPQAKLWVSNCERHGPWQDLVEQYLQVPIDELRKKLEGACERVYERDLSLTTDDVAIHPKAFLQSDQQIVSMANEHHQPPHGDAPCKDPHTVRDLLMEANVGVYGAYIPYRTVF